MYKRNIIEHLSAALNDTSVVLLNGARQTGKSTLCQQIGEKINANYFTLDDAATLNIARSHPEGFIQNIQDSIIIDEIQFAPELFPIIKISVDRDRKPGRFLLTGSANVLVLPHLSESLAGRIEILNLWPFSQGEIQGQKENFIDQIFLNKLSSNFQSTLTLNQLIEKILCGGFPEILKRSDLNRRHAWYQSYIDTILQKDVRELAEIEGLIELPRLLKLLAARSSALLNFAELSRSLSIPQTTLKRYISLLEATFLAQRLPAWSGNLGKRLVKSPKILICDTGMCGYLMGLNQERLMQDKTILGRLLENFVVMELKKQMGWNQTIVQLFHFRTQANAEVDLIMEDMSGKIVGIEIKSSSTLEKKDFKGLVTLQEMVGKRFHRGIVLYMGEKVIPYDKNINACPIDIIWNGN